MADQTHKLAGFVGFDWGTYYVTKTGRVWLIQSEDRDDLPVEVQSLPDGGERLSDATCYDMDLTGVED